MRFLLLLLPGLILMAPALEAQTKEPVRVTDMLKIKTAGDIHLSMDGRTAVFTLTTIEPDTAGKTAKWDYKYLTQLYLVPGDGSAAPRPLTTSKDGASQPAWSPDGRQIAFVRSVDGKPQVFLLSFDGGEPTQLTRFRYGASSPKWSPDGKLILFNARIGLKELIKDSLLNPTHTIPSWPDEKPGITGNTLLHPSKTKPDPDGSLDEIRAYLDNDITDKKAKVVTKLNFQDEMEVNPEMTFSHWFTQPVFPGSAPGASPAVPTPITHGFYNFNSADFSADGSSIFFVAHIDSTQSPDRALESEIYMANKDGSNLTKLLGEKDKVYGNPPPQPRRQIPGLSGQPDFVRIRSAAGPG